MRSKRLRAGRVYVRRERPRAAIALTVLMMAALGLFVVFGKPAIAHLEGADAALKTGADADTPKTTREVSFEGVTVHLVSLGAAARPDEARIEAARYVQRGAAGYVYPWGNAYQVIGAAYSQKDQADAVAARLAQDEEIDCSVIALSAPAVRLQVTAANEKTDALVAAERTFRELLDALAAHAQALDKAEAEPVLIRAALSIEANQAAAARDALVRAAGTDQGAVAGALAGALGSLKDTCQALYESDQPTVLTLSSRLKYAYVSTMVDYAAFLDGLTPG